MGEMAGAGDGALEACACLEQMENVALTGDIS